MILHIRKLTAYNTIMNYYRIYQQLIDKRKNKDILPSDIYKEIHHIKPRSCQGTNDPDNLVALTAREHLIAHKLLYRMYRQSYEMDKAKKMNSAVMLMTGYNHIKTSRDYEKTRLNTMVRSKRDFDELYDFLRNYSRDILGNVFNTRFINYSSLVDLIERYFALQTIDYTMISDYEVLKRNMSQEVYYGYKNFVENNQHLTDRQIQTLFGMFKTYQ